MGVYQNLFKPLKVNSLTLKNRIIAAPMDGGFIDAHKMEFLAARSRGGASLVILGSCHADNDRSHIAPGWPGLYDPFIEGFMDELNIIHQYGASASLEIMHAGLWADVAAFGRRPLGPVDMIRNIGKDADGVKVDAMTEDDMAKVADSFASTAARAKRLGFDMVMLHFAHGWLPAQFLSPKFNTRTDAYGGSPENRAKFPAMIIDRVRKAVGADFPIDMRISGDERCEDGIRPEEVIRFVQLVEDRIDMVHVSSGIDKYLDLTTFVEPPQLYPHRINVHLADAMKKAVKIPVVTVGGITGPDEAEQILAEGKADCIAMARALLADPDWPEKARKGLEREIVPCLRCLSCYHVATDRFTHGCAVNPVFGREDRVGADLRRPRSALSVVVVGGGPAGMKAAVTAAERGHTVTLYEKSGRLGGLLNISEHERTKIDLNNYRKYLVDKVLNSGIVVHLDTEATPDLVKAQAPDAVIVAVGSVPNKPPIKGADLPHVVQAIDAYRIIPRLGRRIVIIGGGEIGCELGLCLAEAGRDVSIIEMAGRLAPLGNHLYRAGLMLLMEKCKSLSWETETACREITAKGVLVRGVDGKETLLDADTVILATGMMAQKDVAASFQGIVYDVKVIGDCVRPRRVDDATYEGFFAITSL